MNPVPRKKYVMMPVMGAARANITTRFMAALCAKPDPSRKELCLAHTCHTCAMHRGCGLLERSSVIEQKVSFLDRVPTRCNQMQSDDMQCTR